MSSNHFLRGYSPVAQFDPTGKEGDGPEEVDEEVLRWVQNAWEHDGGREWISPQVAREHRRARARDNIW